MKVHYNINKSPTIYHTRLQSYNQFYSDTDFVRIALPRWIEHAKVDEEIKIKYGKLFVKRYLKYCNLASMRCILPLAEKVVPLLSTREKSEHFLMSALYKVMGPLDTSM